jgi:ATP synthase protein I
MWTFVRKQWIVGCVFSITLTMLSVSHMLSALWGVLAVALPSTFFALRLRFATSNASAKAAVFLVGEFLKIAATLVIMAIAAVFYSDLVWWAMLLALVVTVKSYFLTFILK